MVKYNLAILLAVALFASCEKETVSNNSSTDFNLDSMVPTSARAGDTVILYGKNFSFDLAEAAILIGNDSTKLVHKTESTLSFVVQNKFSDTTVNLHVNSEVIEGFPLEYRYIAVVTTIAGTGDAGLRNGAGFEANFRCPWGLALDGNILYVADNYNHRIRTIDLSDSGFYVNDINPTIAGFYNPYNIAVDTANHSLFVTNFHDKVLKVDAQGTPNVIYTSSSLTTSTGIAVGPDKMVYVGDNIGNRIFKIDQNGANRSEVCSMVLPRRLLFDNNGHLYAINGHIMRVKQDGSLEHFEQDVQFQGWEFVIDKSGDFIQADHFTNKIQKVDRSTGKVTTIAGSGKAQDVDGIGTAASFNGPMSIVMDTAGDLYVSTYNFDTDGGNRIRKITFQ